MAVCLGIAINLAKAFNKLKMYAKFYDEPYCNHFHVIELPNAEELTLFAAYSAWS